MAWYERLFQTLFRLLFMLLDLIVYTCVRIFYNLFDAISQIRLFTSENGESTLITEVADRLYVLIGVYALFKVTFVLINMMVNPSDGSKGEKSVGKLATRIFVMLALTILVPFIFEKAYELQDAVLSENVIGQIIMPDIYDDIGEDEDIGQNIANQIFSSFVTIDSDAMENPDQNITDIADIDPSTMLNADAKDACNDSLTALIELYSVSDTGAVDTNTGVSTIFPVITKVYENSETGKDEFCIHYTFLISTVAGGFAAFIFAVYCLDIGLRVAKLAFYELIAPIPIVSYIDGKKDGPFYKWAKSAVMAFADIFIRLMIINFVLLLIIDGVPELMNIPEIQGHDLATQFFAKAAVILGLLMFAKQAPDLIKDMFGIKGDGSGSYGLNPMKKISPVATKAGKAALVGGAVGTAALVANTGKAIAEGKKNYTDQKAKNIKAGKRFAGARAFSKTTLGGIGSAMGGATSGTLRGLRAGMSKDAKVGKSIGDQLMTTTNKRDLRDYRKEAGYTFGKRTQDRALNFFGQKPIAKREVEARESKIEQLRRAAMNYENIATNSASKLNFDEIKAMDQMQTITENQYLSGPYNRNGRTYYALLEKDENGNVSNVRDSNGKMIELTNEAQLEYKRSRQEAERISEQIIKETKAKKTYDAAVNEMERKKQG